MLRKIVSDLDLADFSHPNVCSLDSTKRISMVIDSKQLNYPAVRCNKSGVIKVIKSLSNLLIFSSTYKWEDQVRSENRVERNNIKWCDFEDRNIAEYS